MTAPPDTRLPDTRLPARTFSVSIRCEWQALYEQIWRPEMFARWAAGLADSALRQDGNRWVADGSDGPVALRFTPHNPFGVMDHWVDQGSAGGEINASGEIYVPLRVVANGTGAEVLLTLYRQPGMTDEHFAADIKLINRDLRSLKTLIERAG